jgi:hypothetical protein
MASVLAWNTVCRYRSTRGTCCIHTVQIHRWDTAQRDYRYNRSSCVTWSKHTVLYSTETWGIHYSGGTDPHVRYTVHRQYRSTYESLGRVHRQYSPKHVSCSTQTVQIHSWDMHYNRITHWICRTKSVQNNTRIIKYTNSKDAHVEYRTQRVSTDPHVEHGKQTVQNHTWNICTGHRHYRSTGGGTCSIRTVQTHTWRIQYTDSSPHREHAVQQMVQIHA